MVDTPATSESATRPSNGWSGEVDDALERFKAGGCVVILAESDDGSASRLVERLPSDIRVHANVVAARASKARVGAVAEELRLDELDSGEAVVVEEAQWADPTSLGRLERLVAEGSKALLLMISHRPLSEVDAWWLAKFSEEARRHARLLDIKLEPSETDASGVELDKRGADLVIATRLVTGPISVPVAAELLAMTEDEVLGLGEALAQQGWIRQERGGFACVADATGFIPGDVRTGYVAGKLAEVMEGRHAAPAMLGGLRLAAGQPDLAFPLLAAAADDAEKRHAAGEAFHLAEDALNAAEEAGITDDERLGQLHLICGRFLRFAGRTDWARNHLERATSFLEGVARVDALGFAAAVADDAQHPQEAERIIAMAELEATQLGETAKLGSLSTFRARTLSRLGFGEEADSVLAKGQALLQLGSSLHQRFNASQNKAWIHFDRGEASVAVAEFTHLRDEALQLEGEVSVADKEAWRARSLFAAGEPGEAVEAIRRVEELAARNDVEAPLFLAQLALAEGGLLYGRYEPALAASERVLDLIRRQFPAWENSARSYRAEALLRLGQLDEAKDEIAKAISASPAGADGWRWRIRCRALEMEIAAVAGERWAAREAEDLADLMLQSRFYHWAADLLCAIATHGKRKSAASEAMAIAVKVGRPMTAARAASIGSLWEDPAAGPVISAIRAIESDIPSDWESEWRELAWVREGLEAPQPADDAETLAATAALDEALRKAGLAGDEMVLSPAQRRSRGLVRRPRVLRPLQWVAAALGVVVLAGGTALAVVSLNADDSPAGTTAAPVVQQTTVPAPVATLEETQVAVSGEVRLAGTSELRGGSARTGYIDSNGIRDTSGYYWRIRTAGAVEATPVAYGTQLFVGSTDGTFYALSQEDGNQNWTKPAEGRISTAPALGPANFGEGPVEMMVVLVDDDGLIRAFRADDGTEEWRDDLGARLRSTPVVADGIAYVGTDAGFVHAYELTTGAHLWTYPEADTGIGAISADLTYADGFLYVGTQEGELHVVEVTARQPQACEFDARDAITVNPIVADGVLYVPTAGQLIWILPAGSCSGSVPDRQPFYVTESPIETAPAIVGNTILLPSTRFLYARDLTTWEFVWPADKVTGESNISAPPVVDAQTVYFADEDGLVQAVDLATGDLLWKWRTGLHVRGSPAVVDSAAFIVSGDATVTAIGQGEVVVDEEG